MHHLIFILSIMGLALLPIKADLDFLGCSGKTADSGDKVYVTIKKDGDKISVNQTSSSEPTEMLSNSSDNCPIECLYRLQSYLSDGGDNILQVPDPYPTLIPLGYTLISSNKTLYCARDKDYCGATIPLYRYYKVDASGLYHTYSFNNSGLSNYTQEPLALCYGWSSSGTKEKAREARGVKIMNAVDDTCGGSVKTSSGDLVDLNEFVNNKLGTMNDHYLTTRSSSDSKLSGYQLSKKYGKVLNSTKQSSCDCLVELQQMVDNQTGLFRLLGGRLDHKLADNEANRAFEQYSDEGEKVYCARDQGACGATLPLYKHFQVLEMDSIYSTDDSPILFAVRYPTSPLCYIWTTDYSYTSSSSSSSTTTSTSTSSSTTKSSTASSSSSSPTSTSTTASSSSSPSSTSTTASSSSSPTSTSTTKSSSSSTTSTTASSSSSSPTSTSTTASSSSSPSSTSTTASSSSSPTSTSTTKSSSSSTTSTTASSSSSPTSTSTTASSSSSPTSTSTTKSSSSSPTSTSTTASSSSSPSTTSTTVSSSKSTTTSPSSSTSTTVSSSSSSPTSTTSTTKSSTASSSSSTTTASSSSSSSSPTSTSTTTASSSSPSSSTSPSSTASTTSKSKRRIRSIRTVNALAKIRTPQNARYAL